MQSYDFEAMRALAKKVEDGANDLEQLAGTIDGAVREMASAWKDPAQQKFEEQWTEMSKKLKDYAPVIREYSTAVRKHADKIEEAGREL